MSRDKDLKALETLGDSEKVTAVANFEGVASLSSGMESLMVWADPCGAESDEGHPGEWEPGPLKSQRQW